MTNPELRVTYCSAEKELGKGALPPDELYLSERIRLFVAHCRDKNLGWAILSAEHGLLFPTDKVSPYDVTMRFRGGRVTFLVNGQDATNSDVRWATLTQKILGQLQRHTIGGIAFMCNSRRQASYCAALHVALDSCAELHGSDRLLVDCLGRAGGIRLCGSVGEL